MAKFGVEYTKQGYEIRYMQGGTRLAYRVTDTGEREKCRDDDTGEEWYRPIYTYEDVDERDAVHRIVWRDHEVEHCGSPEEMATYMLTRDGMVGDMTAEHFYRAVSCQHHAMRPDWGPRLEMTMGGAVKVYPDGDGGWTKRRPRRTAGGDS